MTATIKIKNSSTTGAVPTSGDLVQGELAINVTDRGLYTENASGTVVKLNAPSIDDKNTGATKHVIVETSGNIGIGTSPSSLLDLYNATSAVLNVQGDSSTSIYSSRYSTNTSAPIIGMQKYRGSYTSPSIVSSGDNTGRVIFYGYDGSSSIPTAEIRSYVDGTPGSGDMPGRLSFWTTADGASTATERARIDSSGNVSVISSGGLGYGTGSGGTVTQATSRTTGVTLNKTNGAITLVSAAGSTTIQSFTVTNSTVAATDTIIVNQKSGTDLYRIYVTAVAAGSFKISYATLSGTTTEQPVFNFSVIKAVTS